MKRASGVLMHLSSLWGEYGIGDCGKPAREFIDFLSDAGFSYWQMLPLNITDGSNSPYKSPSAFAVNPYFIDLDDLKNRGLLTGSELESAGQKTPYACEFSRLYNERMKLIKKAAERADDALKAEVDKFLLSKPDIEAACEFLSGRENEGMGADAFTWRFSQYIFFEQWAKLREYAAKKGIKLIGDIPIYVAPDSCDINAHPKQFLLDEKRRPTCVAGVPPDYFAPKGQLWGNPLYNWAEMKKDGFSWWRERMRLVSELFDGVRIDHFRAIESYWSLPADAEDATVGKWVKGPGMDFVKMLREEAGDKLIIAEDLGDITKEVVELVDKSGFPGMRVFQFGFPDSPSSPHKIHNYVENCVAYTGTHDNNTLLGYMWEIDEATRNEITDYVGAKKGNIDDGVAQILRSMLMSRASLVIFPIQDLLRYGADTRMNVPGRADGNWSYRVTKEQINSIDKRYFRRMNERYGRIRLQNEQ